MRFDGITAAQHRLLIELTGRISTRLATEFEKRPGPEGPNVEVTLAERGKSGRLEIPYACSKRPSRTRWRAMRCGCGSKRRATGCSFARPLHGHARPRTDIAPLGDPAVWNLGNFGRGGGRGRR